MNDLNAGADTSALAPAADSSADPTAGLQAYFESQESSQVENLGEDTDAAEPAADIPDAAEAEPPEPEADLAEETDDTPEAETDTTVAADVADAEEIEANFKALENPTPEFLDADGLKAKFPRQSKEFYLEAARYSDAAKKGNEVVTSLGGEHYIPSLAKISQGLQEGTTRGIFEGIAESSGADRLLTVFGDAIEIALLNADHFIANPDTTAFGTSLKALGDAALQKRFGENITAEKLEKMAQLAETGWLEKIEKWQTDNWVDRDEATELLEAASNPKLQAALAETAKVKAQLEEKNAQAQKASTVRDLEVDNSFSKAVTDDVGKTLETVIWSTSTLRDITSDTPEMKAEKAFLRGVLKQHAIDSFNASDARTALLESYKQGKSGTATFKTELVKAINSAALNTKENTAIAERMLAKIYSKTRNAKLAPKQDDTTPGLEPTVPDQNERTDTPKTSEQVYAELERRIAAMP